MWKAIIYKEWLKTRWVIGGLCLLGISLLIYIFISLGKVFNVMGMIKIWDLIINGHQVLYSELKYYPILFGIVLSIMQFIPEIGKNRLKLTLHLPMSEKKSYFSMQLYGIAILVLSFFIQLSILHIYSIIYFPKEITDNIFITILPWYGAGIVAYIFGALVCLEPKWTRRTVYILLACSVLYFFYLSEYPGAYQYVWWIILAIPIYIFISPWQSVIRFKKGIQ